MLNAIFQIIMTLVWVGLVVVWYYLGKTRGKLEVRGQMLVRLRDYMAKMDASKMDYAEFSNDLLDMIWDEPQGFTNGKWVMSRLKDKHKS